MYVISNFSYIVKSFYKKSLKNIKKFVDIYTSTKLAIIEIPIVSNIMTVCLKNSTFKFKYLFCLKFLYNFIPLLAKINIIGKNIKFCNNKDEIEKKLP